MIWRRAPNQAILTASGPGGTLSATNTITVNLPPSPHVSSLSLAGGTPVITRRGKGDTSAFE